MCESGSELVDSCWKKELTELRSLIARGYPVDGVDESGLTPLHVCASIGWSEAVSILLKYGANVHATSPHGWTALMQAVSNDHVDTARILLNAGARLTDQNASGWDVLSLAVTSSDETFREILASTRMTHDLKLALASACQQGKVQAVKLLLGRGANVNGALPISGITPLMLAACEGHVNIVDILLSFGANPYILNSSNLTAIDCAMINGYNDLSSILSHHTKTQPKIRPTFTFTSYPPTKTSPKMITDITADPSLFGLHPCTPTCKTPGSFSENSLKCASNSATPCEKFCSAAALHPFSPRCQTPGLLPQSPKFFKFPPSPTYTCSSGCMPCSPCMPIPSCNYSKNFHSSPLFSPNPLVPPWMFSQDKKAIKTVPKCKEKGAKSILSWWKRLRRRYKNIKPKKRVKVYVTFDEKFSSDIQLEILLRSLNLDFMIPLMTSHEMDVETFIHLTELDLDELGIIDKGLKNHILMKIRDFKCSIASNTFHQGIKCH
ncbi:Ankyrin repeat and SAM domain-containing protein 6 [Frankliniella fusca]|uniref:NAD(+) ADP-ribosyltransferase n=1 Tax=Frankliniella fusca TaxID=407009 RepID=A0AAE1HM44_9NEOP|nr:Ankyrin repeat and SAM domain-containing protein 6 [Frankliniella fusca]